MERGGAVLLVGAPGVGKSALGRFLQQQQPATTRFLSIGDHLRSVGLVQLQQQRPTQARRAELRREAPAELERACREWVGGNCGAGEAGGEGACAPGGSETAVPPRRLLLLECVKEVADAFVVVEVLEKYKVPLLQVLYLPTSIASTLHVWAAGSYALFSILYNEPLVDNTEWQAMWEANAARVLEFFSALGLLIEVTPAAPAPGGAHGTLAALGYGAAPAYTGEVPEPVQKYDPFSWRAIRSPPAHGSSAAAANKPKPSPLEWLRLGSSLRLTPLQCVTSRRLVTSAVQRSRVLAEAARASGLGRLFGAGGGDSDGEVGSSWPGGGSSVPLPGITASVTSSADARWVGWPGRYAVSRKCDGTRHLLIVVGQQSAVAESGCGGSDGSGSGNGSDGACGGVGGSSDVGGGSCDGGSEWGGGGGGGGGGASVYLLNRIGSLYRYPVELGGVSEGGSTARGSTKGAAGGAAPLPPGTLLDGELVWVGGRGFFLAFDALCVGATRLWHLPLRERLEAMQQRLGLVEAEGAAELKAAAAEAAAAAAHSASGGAGDSLRGRLGSSAPRLQKKQQAPPPGAAALTLLRKQHVEVCAEALLQLEKTRAACPYPTDGLVFTPYGMPYVLGMAELSYKWQRPDDVGVHLSGAALNPSTRCHGNNSNTTLHPALVYECRMRGPALEPFPESVRWDKAHGNAAEVVLRLKEVACRRAVGTAAQLASEVGEAQQEAYRQQLSPCTETAAGGIKQYLSVQTTAGRQGGAEEHGGSQQGSSSVKGGRGERDTVAPAAAASAAPAAAAPVPAAAAALPPHPARLLPYDELYGKVLAAVAAGTVERWVDGATGLEVFNYTRCRGTVGPLERLCRGLVLHPPSRSVVATPFASFDDLVAPEQETDETMELSPPAEQGVAPNGALPGPTLPDPQADGLAAASVKVDGSLIVVFSWGGAVRTATRRRMDSEQALWAADWLRTHAHTAAFEPGWTYMLEAVYDNDTHVVPYLFEGLVLLGAVDPRGAELPLPQLPALAAVLGVTAAVPYITGSVRQLVSRLPGCRPCYRGSNTGHSVDSSKLEPPPPPSFEGWVLTAADGSRHKLVQASYKSTSAAAQALHPLVVWERIKYGGESRASLPLGLPAHFRAELGAVLEALEAGYYASRQELGLLLGRAIERGQVEQLRQLAEQAWQQQGAAAAVLGGGAAAGDVDPPQQEPQAPHAADAASVGVVAQLQAAMQALHLDEPPAASAGAPSALSSSPSSSAAASSATSSPAAAAAAAPGNIPAAALVSAEDSGEQPSATATAAAGVSAARPAGAGARGDGTGGRGSQDGGSSGAAAAPTAPAADEALQQQQQQQHEAPPPPAGPYDNCPAFHRALACECAYASAPDWSVNFNCLALSPYYGDRAHVRRGHVPHLRPLLLDCVRPTPDGRLPGYTPSPNFAQTWAKGWARRGPEAVRFVHSTVPPPLLHAVLPDAMLEQCLAPLEGRDVVGAMMVCAKWREVLLRGAALPDSLARLQAEGLRAAIERARGRLREAERRAQQHVRDALLHADG